MTQFSRDLFQTLERENPCNWKKEDKATKEETRHQNGIRGRKDR